MLIAAHFRRRMAEIAEQLLNESIVVAVSRRAARDRGDILRLGQIKVLYGRDDALVVKTDFDGLLLGDFRVEE